MRIDTRVAIAVFALLVTLPARSAEPVQGNPHIFIELAKKTVPSVVNISTMSTVKNPYYRGGEEMFRKFFEDFFRYHGGGRGLGPDEEGEGEEEMPPYPKGQNPKDAPKAMSLGTGFIIDPSGLILTNNHVVAEADEIKINFTEEEDEKPADGEVVGRDPELDLALIKVKTSRKLVPLPFGDSDALEVGEYVAAIGNPFGQGHTVTHGIISAKGRKAPDFVLANYLQTDTPINPGNSGGPLVNLKGEVIAINNAINPQAQGIGFAIPVNLVKEVLPQLRAKGSVTRGYIGVEIAELTPEIATKIKAPKDLRAPFATNVIAGGPAAKGGMKNYDVIIEVAGKKVKSGADLVRAVTAQKVGEKVAMKVLRQGKEKSLSVPIAKRPATREESREERDSKKTPKQKESARVETGMELEAMSPQIAKELGMPEKTKGVVVNEIAYGGPADKAGVMRGDVIVEVDQKAVGGVEGFFGLIEDKKSYLLRVRRADPQGGDAFLVLVLDLSA